MRKTWEAIPDFWRNATVATMLLCGIAGAESARDFVFSLPHGRFPARILGVMQSQVILYNPAVTGYYENLFSKVRGEIGLEAGRPQERTFRLRRNKANVPGRTNEFGLTGPDTSLTKPQNTRRIAIFGDSLTTGFRASTFRQSYPALFEQRLNAEHAGGPGQQLEVLNFAVSGNKLTQILDVAIEDAPRFAPDVYVLALTELQVFKPWDAHVVQLIQADIDLKYDFLREIVRQAGAGHADDSATLFAKLAPFRIPALRTMLTRMKEAAAASGAPFLVMLVPAVEDADVTQQRLAGMRELLASLDIVTVDALDTFDNVADLDSVRGYPADVHPNNKGYAMVAENLYARFRAHPAAWAILTGQNKY